MCCSCYSFTSCSSFFSLCHVWFLLFICSSPGGSDGRCWILGTRRFRENCFGTTTNCKTCTPMCLLVSVFWLFFNWFLRLVQLFSTGKSLFCLFQPMMDRNCSDQLPKMQCGFIDFVCSFVYKVMDSSYRVLYKHGFSKKRESGISKLSVTAGI